MRKKFPTETNDSDREKADGIYLLGLIIQDRTDDAVAFEKKQTAAKKKLQMGVYEIDALRRNGLGRQVYTFLEKVLADDPSIPLWESYIHLAAREGAAPAALQLLKMTLARPDLSEESRSAVNSYYYLALLAANEVDEGIAVLQTLLKKEPATAPVDESDLGNAELRMIDRAKKLALIGRLLEKPDLVKEGLDANLKYLEKLPASHYSRSSETKVLAELLLKNGRGPEAESLLTQELIHKSKSLPENMRRMEWDTAGLLTGLAGLYADAGRSADVLKLLDESPQWGFADLRGVQSQSYAHFARKPLVLMTVRALADTGKTGEARQLIRQAMPLQLGKDAAYALLLELGTDDAEGFLDALAARDRFEERPLIWKARLQLDAGRVDEAEKTIRAAIAIDPSDGEQGKGDRMRAYTVLGDILEKKGDLENAKIMRGAVLAIRESEDADDWWEAGLLTAAVRKYEASLRHFADAYCIQSRLARSYSELGQYDKAEEHYRWAYELMPVSFGRVESHCFGCERAFADKRAQGAAESVFTRLAEKMPDKAQVFYLLGYLRAEQERHAEAADDFRKAVKLDPDYLNAWSKLLGTADDIGMAQAEREAITFEILRLDPASRHSSVNFEKITNLPVLWETILKTENSLPPLDDSPFYPLVASKSALEKQLLQNPRESRRFQVFRSPEETLRSKFTANALIRSTLSVLDGLRPVR